MSVNAVDGAHRSAALFNNRHLVTVVTAIDALARHSNFTTRQVASVVDLPDSLVRSVVQRLIAAGLLVEVARLGGARGTRQLRTNPDAPWTELQSLCAALLPDNTTEE